MAKEKRLSAGIQKFLEDKKREEEEEEERARQKKKELVARRDPKEQRKIEKSLKVIKSSRKFYSGESTQDDSTVALENEQPDDDDYGYSSAVSDIFHKKLMEKYQKIPEEKKFSSSSSKSRAMTKEEMNRAKDRIKDAFVSKDDGQQPLRQGPQHRTSKLKSNKVISTGSGPSPAESKKNFIKPKPKLKAAPIVDFQQLLKLAEQKQHEEITIDVPTKKEPERLLTSKEKREQEEIEAARKARLKPNRIARTGATLLRVGESSKHDGNNNENSTKKPMNPPPPRPLTKPSISQQRTVQGTADRSKKPAASQAGSSSSKLRDALQTQNGTATKPSSSNKVPVSSSKAELSSNSPSKAPTKSATNGQRPSNDKNRPSTSSREPDRPREFPPKDLMRSREFPPRDLMRGREFPPRDLMRGREFPPKDMMRSREFPPRGLKRPNQLPMSNSRKFADNIHCEVSHFIK